MINFSWDMVLLLLAAGFASGFIDALVGGGGLISLPAFLIVGLSPGLALGTNKFSATCGIIMSSFTFYRSGKVDKELLKRIMPASFAASAFGAYVVMQIPPLYLKPIIVVLLAAVLLFVVFKKDWGSVEAPRERTFKQLVLAFLFAAAMGLYDGFIGPGTGTFLIFGLIFMGFNFVNAAGNAKCMNMASNIGGLLIFMLYGNVDYIYGGLMAVSTFIGAYFGAKLAILKGSQFVRWVFIVMTSVMIGKLIWDYLQTW